MRLQSLVAEVEKYSTQLPMEVSEGTYITKVSYVDSIYEITAEVDSYEYEVMCSRSHEAKELLLFDISTIDGEERHQHEIMVNYNIYLKYIYKERNSNRFFTITLSPHEIKMALQENNDPEDSLKKYIHFQKQYLSSEVNDRIINDIQLYGKNVHCYIITEDKSVDVYEKNIDVFNEEMQELRENLYKDKIFQGQKRFADRANYGIIIHFVGKNKGKEITYKL